MAGCAQLEVKGTRETAPGTSPGRLSVPAGMRVGIACGGTGGHLFPGMAVAEVLLEAGAWVTLFVSPKEVDRRSVRGLRGVEVVTLPVAAWQAGSRVACLRGMVGAWIRVRRHLRGVAGWVVLGMGGFSSVPVVAAARWLGCPVVLHEANAVPGRANRWLARWAERVLVGFEEAGRAWRGVEVRVTGTPVRREIAELAGWDAGRRLERRRQVLSELGLDGARSTVLVVGGSQGARGLNERVTACAVNWQGTGRGVPQWIHLTGVQDEERIRGVYRSAGVPAVVMAFSDRMVDLLVAADAVVARSGASFLAELAAARVPAVLIPFPAAVDDHQWHNARLYAETGAARLLGQSEAVPDRLRRELELLLWDERVRSGMVESLGRWHRPGAAAAVVEELVVVAGWNRGTVREPRAGGKAGRG